MKKTQRLLGVLMAAALLFGCTSVFASANIAEQLLGDVVSIPLDYGSMDGIYDKGGNAVEFDKVDDTTTFKDKLPKPKADGYTFLGWSLDPSDVLEIGSTATLKLITDETLVLLPAEEDADAGTEGEGEGEGEEAAADDATPAKLYAIWAKNYYTLNFYLQSDSKDAYASFDNKAAECSDILLGYTSGDAIVAWPKPDTGKAFGGWKNGGGSILGSSAGKITYSFKDLLGFAGVGSNATMEKSDSGDVEIAGIKFKSIVGKLFAKWYDTGAVLKETSYSVQYKNGEAQIDFLYQSDKDYGPIKWRKANDDDNDIVSITDDGKITPLKTTGMKAAGPVEYVGEIQAAGAENLKIKVYVTVAWWQYLIIIPLLGILWY